VSLDRLLAGGWRWGGRALGCKPLSPKGLRAHDGALGGVSQDEDAGGRWKHGLAVVAWQMKVGSNLQLVAVGMGQLCVLLCQQL